MQCLGKGSILELKRREVAHMKLYLVQHGESKPEDVDPGRGLTNKGIADVRKVADFLKPLRADVKAVWHSGKTRAQQTAEILTDVVAAGDFQVREGLAPNDPVDPVKDKLALIHNDLMIVGHLPFLGKLASILVAGSESADVVAFRHGGIVCLERDETGAWRVHWMVTPEILG
jgi:phosphohistidine phosphatase